MKNEEIKKLYDYCKNRGYNETAEQFEDDLKQIIVEEIGTDNLKKITGGKMKMSKKIAAGLLSLLSLGSSMNSTYAVFDSGSKTSSEISASKAIKSANTLKKILFGGVGTALAGGAAITGGALGFNKLRSNFNDHSAQDIKNVEDAKKIFDKYNLDDTEIISSINGGNVYFYWKEGSEIRTASRPMISANLARIIYDGFGGEELRDRLIYDVGQHIRVAGGISIGLEHYSIGEELPKNLFSEGIKLSEKDKNYIENKTLKMRKMFPYIKGVNRELLAQLRYACKGFGQVVNFSSKMNQFPEYSEWERIIEEIESKSKSSNSSQVVDEMLALIRGNGSDYNWGLYGCKDWHNSEYNGKQIDSVFLLRAMVFYPEVFGNINFSICV